MNNLYAMGAAPWRQSLQLLILARYVTSMLTALA